MAASAVPVAGTMEIRQVGDVTVGERRDLVLVDNGRDTAALVEKTTTTAAVPVEGGTALVQNVEYTPVAAATYTTREQQQQREHTDNYQSTQRIPSNVNRQRTAPPSRPHPSAPSRRQQQQDPPPYDQVAHRNVHTRTCWDKCFRYFYIMWMILVVCLGVAGALFIGLGELTRKCSDPTKNIAIFDLWTSSFVTGAVMVLFSAIVCLSAMAYHCCCKKQRELCIGLVVGFGIVALFFFIIAYGFNISSVGLVVDTPPTADERNSTNHDSKCLSPYWLAYVPSFVLGAVILGACLNLSCCLCCRLCTCQRRKGYVRVP